MSNYVWGSSQSYQDFLQQKSHFDGVIDAVNLQIPRQTRELIASQADFQEQNAQLIEGFQNSVNEGLDLVSGIVERGFDRVTYKLDNIYDGIMELNARFEWSFSQLIMQVGKMNDKLETLVHLAKTPVQVSSFNQFEIARENYRKGLYIEALERLNAAINGVPGVSDGFKEEWRFHNLIGLIKLGRKGNDTACINLPEAESSLLTAAKYAAVDFPVNSSVAYMSAGWAAYCQGKMNSALDHLKQAVSINSKLGEALFLLSKVFMAINQPNDAIPYLRKALDINRFYSVKAGADGDFHKYIVALNEFIKEYSAELYFILEHEYSNYVADNPKECLPVNSDSTFRKIIGKKVLLHYPKAEKEWQAYLDELKDYREKVLAKQKAISNANKVIQKFKVNADILDKNKQYLSQVIVFPQNQLSDISDRINKIVSELDGKTISTYQLKEDTANLYSIMQSLKKELENKINAHFSIDNAKTKSDSYSFDFLSNIDDIFIFLLWIIMIIASYIAIRHLSQFFYNYGDRGFSHTFDMIVSVPFVLAGIGLACYGIYSLVNLQTSKISDKRKAELEEISQKKIWNPTSRN